MSSKPQPRKRSTSTLANTISFTHTRTNNTSSGSSIPIEEDKRFNNNALQRSKTTSLGYLQKNNSSSTLNSITHTLSNVGFNKLTPIDTSHSSGHSSSNNTPLPSPLVLSSTNIGSSNSLRTPISPTMSNLPNASAKIENAISRAKLYAKTKTKDLKRSSKSSEEKHHHHHNFLKKNAHSGLSSAQSNSRLDTGSTLYSFDPSTILDNNDTVMKHVINETNLRSLSFEEKDQMADNLWATVTSTTIRLFKVENKKSLKLKIPIEDINKMLEVYLRLRLENNSTTTSIISELMEFLRNGMNILENELSFDENLLEIAVFSRISSIWDYFFKNIYHYLLGVFLPLQLEINKSSTKNGGPWNEASTDMVPSTKNIILVAFRDFIVLPYLETEIIIPSEMESNERRSLIKCFGMLKSVQSHSYNQEIVKHILTLLLQGLGPL